MDKRGVSYPIITYEQMMGIDRKFDFEKQKDDRAIASDIHNKYFLQFVTKSAIKDILHDPDLQKWDESDEPFNKGFPLHYWDRRFITLNWIKPGRFDDKGQRLASNYCPSDVICVGKCLIRFVLNELKNENGIIMQERFDYLSENITELHEKIMAYAADWSMYELPRA